MNSPLATEDIDVGLSWLTFDLKVAFMVLSKTVTLTPTLNLGNLYLLYGLLRP